MGSRGGSFTAKGGPTKSSQSDQSAQSTGAPADTADSASPGDTALHLHEVQGSMLTMDVMQDDPFHGPVMKTTQQLARRCARATSSVRACADYCIACAFAGIISKTLGAFGSGFGSFNLGGGGSTGDSASRGQKAAKPAEQESSANSWAAF